MRDFGGRSRLGRLDPGGKLVYTSFLVFIVGGLISAALLHHDGMGLDTATATSWWLGDEAQMRYPKSYRQLLELTHFHLFTEPLCFLVVAHLYHLGSQALLLRVGITVGTLLCIAMQIALPWLVSFASPAFAVLFLPVHVGLLLGLLWMSGAAIKEMWLG